MDRSAESFRWRLAFGATLALAMGVSPFALFGMSALAPLAVPDLGLTRTAFGGLVTIGFSVAAVTALVGGRRVDGRDPRTLLLLLFGLGGVTVVAMSSARSLTGLWFAASLAGIGLGLGNPVTNRLIAEHIPAGRQGLLTGAKQSGVSLVQAIAGFVLPGLAVLVGWRVSLVSGALLAVLGLVAAAVIVPSSGVPVERSRRRQKGPVGTGVKWLTLYGLLITVTTPSILIYAPLFAFEELGYSTVVAGLSAGVLGVSGMAARILWGGITDRWGSPRRSLAAIASCAFLSILVVLVSQQGPSWIFWPGLVGFGVSAMAANAVLMLAVISDPGSTGTGRATGVVSVGLFVGRSIGPVSFGFLIDATGSYAIGWLVMAAICLLCLATVAVWSSSVRSPA